MQHFIPILFTAAVLSLGCDGPDDSVALRGVLLDAGEPWGPCTNGSCKGDLYCLAGALGSFCAPTCSVLEACETPALKIPAGQCFVEDRCFVPCGAGEDPCGEYMVCDEFAHLCVWAEE